MIEAQAVVTLRSFGAVYRTTKGHVQWWKATDGSWIAKTVDGRGDVKLQRLPANACDC